MGLPSYFVTLCFRELLPNRYALRASLLNTQANRPGQLGLII